MIKLWSVVDNDEVVMLVLVCVFWWIVIIGII